MLSRGSTMRAYFEPKNCILSNNTKSIKITIQEARCLEYLIKNEGEFIRREVLLQECWSKRGVTVSDSAVRQSLYRLRRAFEDAGLPNLTLTTQAKKGHILQKGSIALIHSDAKTDAYTDNSINPSVPNSINKDVCGEINPRFSVTSLLPIAKLLLLSGLLFLAGFYSYQKIMLTDIKYYHSEEKEGRLYFYRKNQAYPQSAIERIHYWLKNKHVNYDNLKFIYLNNAWSGHVSFYLCKGEMGRAGSDCTSITIIGEHHP